MPADPQAGPEGDEKLALLQKAIEVGVKRLSHGQGSDNWQIFIPP